MIVKASSGPRYVVGCRSKVDKEKLTAGTRVVLDMTTLTIMRALPREVLVVHQHLIICRRELAFQPVVGINKYFSRFLISGHMLSVLGHIYFLA